MLASMTGFVSKTLMIPLGTREHVQLLLSIKTLNSRFFEATCRLAPLFSALETECIKRAKNALNRGHVYLTIHVNNPASLKSSVTLATGTLEGYRAAIAQAQKQYKITGELTIHDLLSIPDLFVAQELAVDEQCKYQLLISIDQALEELHQQRLKEGASLLVDLELRVTTMAKHIKAIAKAFNAIHAKLQKSVQAKLSNTRKIDKSAATLQEFSLVAELDKIDIHEELVRFNTHLKSLSTLLYAKQLEKGRQLDFILQELSREINTITSKCPQTPISGHAISIKVEIEKCREQAQNIV